MLFKPIPGFLLVVILLAAAGCGSSAKTESAPSGESGETSCQATCRGDMRQFVQSISAYGRASNAYFIVVPQNGHQLLTINGEPDGPISEDYAAAIDGVGREDLLFGYEGDNVPTPKAERDRMAAFMNRARSAGVRPLVTDYVASGSNNIAVSYQYHDDPDRRFTSFAATHRDLDNIPSEPDYASYYPYQANDSSFTPALGLSGVKNFLYLLDPSSFADKAAYLAALAATNYDLLILDAYDPDENPLTAADVASLKTKANGGTRLVLAYMSIGEAENYRFYWQESWQPGSPRFIAEENLDWPGNYKVRYWDPDWQAIIAGNSGSYTQKLLDAGFDGVYLDIIDAFEYWEARE